MSLSPLCGLRAAAGHSGAWRKPRRTTFPSRPFLCTQGHTPTHTGSKEVIPRAHHPPFDCGAPGAFCEGETPLLQRRTGVPGSSWRSPAVSTATQSHMCLGVQVACRLHVCQRRGSISISQPPMRRLQPREAPGPSRGHTAEHLPHLDTCKLGAAPPRGKPMQAKLGGPALRPHRLRCPGRGPDSAMPAAQGHAHRVSGPAVGTTNKATVAEPGRGPALAGPW